MGSHAMVMRALEHFTVDRQIMQQRHNDVFALLATPHSI